MLGIAGEVETQPVKERAIPSVLATNIQGKRMRTRACPTVEDDDREDQQIGGKTKHADRCQLVNSYAFKSWLDGGLSTHA